MGLLCGDILELATARGIDLERWLVPKDGWGADFVLPVADFERKLTGLGLGLAAGLAADGARDIERALSREAFDEVGRVAGVDGGIDVRRVLDAAAPGAAPAPAAAPPAPAAAPRGAAARRAARDARRRALVEAAVCDLRHAGAVTPSTCRGVMAALARDAGGAGAVDGAALRRALGARGVRVDIKACDAMVAAAAADAGDDAGARRGAARAPAAAVRAWLAAAFLGPPRRGGTSWDAWNEGKAAASRGRQRREFRKALGGRAHGLGDGELEAMLLKYDVLGPADLDVEVRDLARAFAESHDGHFEALKLAFRGERDGGAARREVELRKRRQLREGEARSGDVTLALWREYARRPRDEFAGDEPFAAWLARSRGDRARRRAEVRRWRGAKDAEAAADKEAGARAAPLDDVVAEVGALYDASLAAVPLAPLVDANRPTRSGLDVNRRLREAVRVAGRDGGVLTKAEFDKTFASLAFSLMADKRVARRARDLADTRTRLAAAAAEARRDGAAPPAAADAASVFAASADDARAAAARLAEGKRTQASEEYGKWLAAKNGALRRARGAEKRDARARGADLEAARGDVAAALDAWRAAQRDAAGVALQRHLARAGGEATDAALAELDAAHDAVAAERRGKGEAAQAATRRWRALKHATLATAPKRAPPPS